MSSPGRVIRYGGAVLFLAMVPAAITAGPPRSQIDALQQETKRLMAAGGALTSVSIRCGDDDVVEVRPTLRLRSASTLKVALVLAVARQERLSGPEIQADADIRRAIIDSDNAAANALIARSGGLAAAEAFMQRIGMRQTRLGVQFGVALDTMLKATTARDLRVLAAGLQDLAKSRTGPLVAAGLSSSQGEALLRLMRQTTHASPLGTAPGAEVAHKSGWLDTVKNDVAVVSWANRPGTPACAVGLMTDGVGADGAAARGKRLLSEVVTPLASLGRMSQQSTPADLIWRFNTGMRGLWRSLDLW